MSPAWRLAIFPYHHSRFGQSIGIGPRAGGQIVPGGWFQLFQIVCRHFSNPIIGNLCQKCVWLLWTHVHIGFEQRIDQSTQLNSHILYDEEKSYIFNVAKNVKYHSFRAMTTNTLPPIPLYGMHKKIQRKYFPIAIRSGGELEKVEMFWFFEKSAKNKWSI